MANEKSMQNQDRIFVARNEPAHDDKSMPWELYRPWRPPEIDLEAIDIACLIREPYGVCGPYERQS